MICSIKLYKLCLYFIFQFKKSKRRLLLQSMYKICDNLGRKMLKCTIVNAHFLINSCVRIQNATLCANAKFMYRENTMIYIQVNIG